jgi:phosphomannomutase
MSGHIFFGDRWHDADDGLYVAMRTLRALARAGTSLREFRESLPPTFATPEIRLLCADARKTEVLAGVAARAAGEVNRTDGLRVTESDGWWLLRASGTEPKLTARVEADSQEALDRLRDGLQRELECFGLSLA